MFANAFEYIKYYDHRSFTIELKDRGNLAFVEEAKGGLHC